MDRYIYYRVRAELATLLQQRVQAMQSQLAAQTMVRCELKRRPVAQDAMDTWMEIYCGIDASFDAYLARGLQAFGVTELIVGARHVDDFLDMSLPPAP